MNEFAYCERCGEWMRMPDGHGVCWYCEWIDNYLRCEDSILKFREDNGNIDHAITAAWDYVTAHGDQPVVETFTRYLTANGYRVTPVERRTRV